MAAPFALDSDDNEFGYDFSPEDEEALLQLSDLPPKSAISAVIDSVPDKTEIVADSDNVGGLHFAHGRAGPRGHAYGNDHSHSGSTLQAAQPRSFPAAVALPEDVSYPDCTLIKFVLVDEAD